MLRRILVLLALIGAGGGALLLGLRAMAQAPTTSAAPAPSTPAASPQAVPAPAQPAAADDDLELRQSADNNISFPVDI